MSIRTLRKYIWSMVGGCILWLALGGLAQAQEVAPAPITVEPATKQIAAGETGEVAIMIADAVELYGFDVALSFDPTVVQAVDANPGTPDRIEVGFGTFLDSGFEVRNVVDNDAGTIRFAMTQINPSLPKSGAGVLLVLTFRGLQAGTSTPLTITNAELSQPRGILIPAAFAEGRGVLEVVAASAAATATPIPVQSGTNLDIALTLTTMAATAEEGPDTVSTPAPVATLAAMPATPAPPVVAVTPAPSLLESLSTIQIVGLTVVSCLALLLLLGALALLLSRRRQRDADETD